MEQILHMKGITKAFSGEEVLHGVELSLCKGEVLALIGENGAGKSTLMKILMGIEQPTGGEIWLEGQRVTIPAPRKALDLGIAMIHQELYPIAEMSIAENMYLGREEKRFGFVRMRAQEQKTVQWLQKLSLDVSPSTKMKDLSISQTQIVEIAKAMSYHSKILIMDEPTSAITEAEVRRLFEIIHQLKAEGMSIIYISHKLDELSHIADRVQILRDGNVISVQDMSALSRQEMVRDMVGRELTTIYPTCNQEIGEVVMEARNLQSGKELKDISFQLRRGEKLGIAGLMGAGRTELVSTIFGARRATGGEIYIHGKKVSPRRPADAIKHGVALVPEDRKLMGLNLCMSVGENTTLCIDSREARAGFLNRARGKALTGQMISELFIKASSGDQPVASLSGGNQQKVVLAKWLLTAPDILLFDEPTRGIDVGAKAEIFSLINNLVMQGKSAVIISSEMPEIVGIADRVLVMCEGRLAGELTGADITQENIMALAAPVRHIQEQEEAL